MLRGASELAPFVYELDRLGEWDIGELEAVVASSAFMAAVETAAGENPKKGKLAPAGGNKNDNQSGQVKEGVEQVDIGSRALWVNNLGAGQSIKFFSPTRPNSNYEAFVKAFITKISNSLGMPYSVAMQIFQASYSAARAEILFFWNAIIRRRADFIDGFLNPFFEAWFTEHVLTTKKIEAPGFSRDKITRLAWLSCTWNGISRPVVDPVKEVKAVAIRLELGHTTGEREAKAYNGSDFMENIARLRTENEFRAEANAPLANALAEPDEPENETDTDLEDTK